MSVTVSNGKNRSFVETVKNSLIFRLFIMGGLMIVLLIPCAMIDSLIYERQERRNSVIDEINSKWALEQTVSGPVLEIPYKVYTTTQNIDKDGVKEVVKMKKCFAYYFPDTLNVSGEVVPEIRYRGIYETIVYTADLRVTGEFSFPNFELLRIPEENVLWDDVILILGISDMRGINKTIGLKWNGVGIEPRPGVRQRTLISGGISVPVVLDPKSRGIGSFDMGLNIRGSREIRFLPLGRKTDIRLNSSWTSPSFSGQFLPKERNIDEKGFTAHWEVFDFNREFPQLYKDQKDENDAVHASAFGMQLFVPVDEYLKTTRSIKYAVLFIALTFLGFFVVIELLNKRRIHPIQYLLVGFALCMFYLLLISLSEHMSFDWAYLIAAFGITGITTVYTRSVSGRTSLTLVMGGLFVSLYGFLYVMLRLEDYALLVGSFGLFVILSGVMFITRKIDWYAPNQPQTREQDVVQNHPSHKTESQP